MLTPREFARARKHMMLTGTVYQESWDKADHYQRDVLHQLQLTVRSITEADIE